MDKNKYVITIFLLAVTLFSFPLYSQETDSESDEATVIESPAEDDLFATDETSVDDSLFEEEVIPDDEIPEDVTPEDITLEETTPDEVTPEEITPEEITPEEITPEEASGSKGRFHFFLDNKLLFAFSVPDGGFGFAETANFQYILPFNLAFGLESGYYGFRGEVENNGVSVVAGYTLIPIYATASFNIPIVENFYITPVLKGGASYTNARINGWLGGDSFSGIFEGGVRFKAFMRGGLLIHGGIMYTGLIEKSGLFSIMSIGFGFGL